MKTTTIAYGFLNSKQLKILSKLCLVLDADLGISTTLQLVK